MHMEVFFIAFLFADAFLSPNRKKIFLLQFFRDFYKYILNIIFYAFFVSKNFNFYYFFHQVMFFAAIKITHDYH